MHKFKPGDIVLYQGREARISCLNNDGTYDIVILDPVYYVQEDSLEEY